MDHPADFADMGFYIFQIFNCEIPDIISNDGLGFQLGQGAERNVQAKT